MYLLICHLFAFYIILLHINAYEQLYQWIMIYSYYVWNSPIEIIISRDLSKPEISLQKSKFFIGCQISQFDGWHNNLNIWNVVSINYNNEKVLSFSNYI